MTKYLIFCRKGGLSKPQDSRSRVYLSGFYTCFCSTWKHSCHLVLQPRFGIRTHSHFLGLYAVF